MKSYLWLIGAQKDVDPHKYLDILWYLLPVEEAFVPVYLNMSGPFCFFVGLIEI